MNYMQDLTDSEDEDNHVRNDEDNIAEGNEDIDDDDDNDEEILADDEEERSDDDDDDDDDDDAADAREDNVEIREGNVDDNAQRNAAEGEQMQVDDNEAVNENEGANAEPGREGRQETLFRGINTEGMRVPLEADEDLRAIDHLLVLLSRTVRHCNTYEQVIDELTWLKKSYRFINLPTTKAALWKTLGWNEENLEYQLFCSKCKDRIGTGNVVERVCRCGVCGPNLDRSNIATFVHIRLTPQLQDLLNTPNIDQSLRYRENRVKIDERNGIEDIYDGQRYKNLRNGDNFLADDNNFSFTMWTDGIKLTKSSPATSYPVIVQLNELSPHSRKQNMFLAGLWVANSHPSMNSILRPVCNELCELYETGIRWRRNDQEVISRFVTLIFVADSVARCDALRMKRFNGRFGCTQCLAEGEMVENTWVYRAGDYQLRTNQYIRQNGQQAVERGRIVNGVKGVSALATLQEIDLRENVPIDCAHNCYLGAAKRLVVRWLTDANEQWYIGHPDSLAAIDAKLLSIKTPTRISRTPRSITLYKMWKASEWRNWLFYYALPCLEGILPHRYLIHLEKLVKAVYILNSDSITEAQLNIAGDLLNVFVRDYQTNYLLKNMVYNVHLLTHLVDCVRNWGPLWVYSSLPYESMNRRITDSIKSPYRIADQVVARFFMRKFVIVASRQIPVANVTRAETSRLLKITNVHVQGMPEAHYFLGLGRSIFRRPEAEEMNLIRAAGHTIRPNENVQVFRRACIHGTEYRIYKNVNRKFCNHIVFTRDSRFFIIEKILYYTVRGVVIAGFIGQSLRFIENAYRVPYMQRLERTREKRFINYSQVRSPGLLVPITENLAAVPLSNVWETD